MEQLINDIQSIYNRIKNSENTPQIEKDLLKKKIMELYEAAIGMDREITFESITREETVDLENPPVEPEISASDILEKDEAFITLEMEEVEKEMFDDEELFEEEPAVGDISYTPPAEEQRAAKEEEEEEIAPTPAEEPIAEEPQEEEALINEPVAEVTEQPEEETTPVNDIPEEEHQPEEVQQPVAEVPVEEPVKEVEQPLAETPTPEVEEETPQPTAEAPKEVQEPPRIIEQLSLNDMAAEGNSNSDIAKKFTEAPIDDLLKSIPVYKRYEFIAELFKNDNEGFDQAMKEINSATSADVAFEYLHETLKPKYNWDEDNELVVDFVAFVRRRFTR